MESNIYVLYIKRIGIWITPAHIKQCCNMKHKRWNTGARVPEFKKPSSVYCSTQKMSELVQQWVSTEIFSFNLDREVKGRASTLLWQAVLVSSKKWTENLPQGNKWLWRDSKFSEHQYKLHYNVFLQYNKHTFAASMGLRAISAKNSADAEAAR